MTRFVNLAAGKRLWRRTVLGYSIRSRRRKAALIAGYIAERNLETTLFVGTGGSVNLNETVLERDIAAVSRVVAACDLYPAHPTAWPYLQADGRSLPFGSQVVDLVLSNAVIEHVGGEEDQRRFVAEHERVGKAWAITTPNRWCPVEAHTYTAFRHWSRAWRDDRTEFTRLLSRGEFKALLPPGSKIIGRVWSPTFIAFSARNPGESHPVSTVG